MKPSRKLSRRSFLAAVAGSAVVAAAGAAHAVRRSDNDTGPRADPANRGTRTGLTDQDRADRPGRGTLSGITDADSADPPQRGRSCNDADPGDPNTPGARRC
ncbi:MAG TPA: hypothetical protein VGB79_14700 [Allosphingosinicella sp.]|jgi:hypothetical protein